MSSLTANLARRAFVRQPLRKVGATTTLPTRRYASTPSKVEEAGLDKGSKRDPELYILLGVMAGAFGLAGWYFGSSPTMSTSESNIRLGQGTMPWEVEDEDVESKGNFKYRYHPHGDESRPLKESPSALNEVVIPNVTLPKDLHDKFNKYGKDY